MGILVAVDLADGTDAVLDKASELAKALAEDIRLIHVAVPHSEYIYYSADGRFAGEVPVQRAVQEEIDHKRVELERLAQRLRDRGLNVETQLLEGSARQGLPKAAQECQPDMIVVGSHGHGRVHTMLLGSTLDSVIRSVTCPVVVVHRPEAHEEKTS